MPTLTTRLSGLLRRMRPERRVRLSVQRSTNAAESLERLASDQPQTSPPGPRGGLLSRMPGARRDAAIAQLQSGFREVVDLVRTVRVHLEQQADRSERLLALMRGMPEALEALPETSRNQSRMAEAINSHVDRQNRQAARLNDVLSGLARAGEHQCQVMGVLQEKIESGRRTDEQLLGSFTAMNQTLVQLSESSQANVQTLRRVSEHNDRAAERMDDLIRRSTRKMAVLSVTGWAVAATALALAAWAALLSAGVL